MNLFADDVTDHDWNHDSCGITKGVHRPPDRPIISFGATSDITAQPKEPKPLPKKDNDIKKMMAVCDST
jgi:hypothetical protein